jgi:hypothetical protein
MISNNKTIKHLRAITHTQTSTKTFTYKYLPNINQDSHQIPLAIAPVQCDNGEEWGEGGGGRDLLKINFCGRDKNLN